MGSRKLSPDEMLGGGGGAGNIPSRGRVAVLFVSSCHKYRD